MFGLEVRFLANRNQGGDKHKTALHIIWTFEFNTMTFGLASAPSVFISCGQCFKGAAAYGMCYADDIRLLRNI